MRSGGHPATTVRLCQVRGHAGGRRVVRVVRLLQTRCRPGLFEFQSTYCGPAALFTGLVAICRCHPPFPQGDVPIATGHEPVSCAEPDEGDGAVTLAHCLSEGVNQISSVTGSQIAILASEDAIRDGAPIDLLSGRR
jgi:hypothetical protein